MPYPKASEILEALEGRHVHTLTAREDGYIAALLLGSNDAEMAMAFFVAAPTVRRHIAIIEEKVLGVLDVTSNRRLLHTWAVIQRECCTRVAFEKVRSDQVFAVLDQHVTRAAR